MPFQSLSQMRACFAKKDSKWNCKEWVKETPNIKSLPKKKKEEGGYSTQGYKKNSPDKNNDFNIISSSNITMKGVNHPIIGIDSTGFQQLMMPNKDYRFNSEHVLEIPLRQQGGLWATNKKGFVDSTLKANKNIDFVQRLYNGTQSIQVPGQKYRSTHLMSYDPQSKRVFPEVVNKNGKLIYLGEGDAPYDYADSTDEFIQFKTPEQAAWFSNSPNHTSGYKMGTNVLGNIEKGIPKRKQDGGTINPNVIDTNYGAAPNLTNLQPLQFNPLGNMKQQKDEANLSYVPMFANSIAAALANRVSNSREKNYEMTNLSNPLNYIPDTNNTNNYVNYGTPSYQEGGEVGANQSDYEDLQDEEFLFEDTPTPQEASPQEQAPATEVASQQDSEFVLPIDESSPEISSDLDPQGFTADLVVPRSEAEGIASSRELDATNYLIQKGLPEHVAAGIIGNLKQESDLNPNATERGGNGRGIAQWDVRDRFQDLKKFAAQTGRPSNDLYTQLDYLLKEADSRGDLNKIKAATNPSEAAYLFAKHFEKPRTIEQIRMKNAERIFKNRKV